MIGNRAPVGEAATFQIGDLLVLQPLTELIEKSGFAAPSFSDNTYHLSLICLYLFNEFCENR